MAPKIFTFFLPRQYYIVPVKAYKVRNDNDKTLSPSSSLQAVFMWLFAQNTWWVTTVGIGESCGSAFYPYPSISAFLLVCWSQCCCIYAHISAFCGWLVLCLFQQVTVTLSAHAKSSIPPFYIPQKQIFFHLLHWRVRIFPCEAPTIKY